MSQMLFGRDNQTAGHSVQTMDDAGAKKSFYRRLAIQMTLQNVRKSPILKISHWMSHKPGWLIHDNQPGILVNNRNDDGFRVQQFVRRLEQTK
jgi:hypothetical protein